MVGRSRSAVTNLLRLLSLAAPVRELVQQGKLGMGHARAVLALSGIQQVEAARSVVARGMSVRETERLVARLMREAVGRKVRRAVDETYCVCKKNSRKNSVPKLRSRHAARAAVRF